MFKNKAKQRNADRPFPAPGYGARYWLNFYLNRPVFEVMGMKFAARHALALGGSGVVLSLWHLFFIPSVTTTLGEAVAFRVSFFLWTVAALAVFYAFVITPETKRRFLVWFGMLPPETRKVGVQSSNEPRMRNLTRGACYFVIGSVAATFAWWVTTFLAYRYYLNGDWENQLYTYSPTLLVMVLFAVAATWHLDRHWIFRKTKLPLLIALAAVLCLFLVIYRWGVETLGWGWYFGPGP